MRVPVIRSLICALWLAPSTALSAQSARSATMDNASPAKPRDPVTRLAADARAAYDRGEYSTAVELYLEAYGAGPAAGLLYNIAVIYDRKLGEKQLAVDFYRRYIRALDAEPAVVKRATRRVQQLKSALKREAEPPLPAPTETPPDPLPREPVPTSVDDDGRLWGWIAGGVGAGLFVGGVILGVAANATESDYHDATTRDEKLDLRDEGHAQALTADILMGVGLTAGAVGAWLLLADRTGEPSPEIGIAPASTGEGALVWIGGGL